MNLVVTGATGYIGRHLVALAMKEGHDVIAATRSRPSQPVSNWLPFELSAIEKFSLPSNTDVIIHLATDTTSILEDGERIEILAAQALIKAAAESAVKLLYLSSQTARQDAPTMYGQLKWKIEQMVLASGGVVVRPGQVYGGQELGLFGRLVDNVRQLPLLPMFLPLPMVQPIHVDDLAKGLLHIVENESLKLGIVCLGSTEPISFTKFLSSISSYRIRRNKLFIPLPTFLITITGMLIGNRLSGRLGIKRLHSLFNLPMMNTATDLNQLGLSLREISSGMHRSGNDKRRRLLQEGKALFTYLLKSCPSSSLLRRYVRAVEKLASGHPLDLPQWLYKLPILFSLFDRRAHLLSNKASDFIWRIDAAMALSEATPKGAELFLSVGRKSGLLVNLCLILRALLGEGFWRVMSFISSPILRICFKQRKF